MTDEEIKQAQDDGHTIMEATLVEFNAEGQKQDEEQQDG